MPTFSPTLAKNHTTSGYRAEDLQYPLRWRAHEPSERTRARFLEPHYATPGGSWKDAGSFPEQEISYTDIEVKQRTHRRIGLQLPYQEKFYMKHSPFDDLEHKKRIADQMLHTYFESGEGRGLNFDTTSGRFFDEGTLKQLYNPRDNSDKYVIEKENDYFSDFRLNKERPTSKSFVKRMEYDIMSGRIDIDLETVDYVYTESPFASHSSAIIKQLKSNLTIIIKSRANPIRRNIPNNEKVAIETLREMITEIEFRKYMKDGFILVRGLSGRVYQIFRDKEHTKVWEKGKLVEEVCVRIKRSLNVPPTDNVIAFRAMILCSEEEFKKLGNVYRMAA